MTGSVLGSRPQNQGPGQGTPWFEEGSCRARIGLAGPTTEEAAMSSVGERLTVTGALGPEAASEEDR